MIKILTFSILICLSLFASGQKNPVWLDTDTGNEMDDLYAIVRLVKEPGIKIAGISSAHFNNPDLLVFEKWNAYNARGLNTVAVSQRIIKVYAKIDTGFLTEDFWKSLKSASR